MRVPGLGTMKRIVKPIRNKFYNKGMILLYHRVNESKNDPQLLNVSSDHFKEHLEILKKDWNLISLSEMALSIKEKRVLDKSIAITFDDGYDDNLYIAKPLLEKFETPAMVYISCNHVEQAREFWWDSLERIFLMPGEIPQLLDVNIGAVNYKINFEKFYKYSDELYNRFRNWDVTKINAPTPRHEAYLNLSRLLHPLSVNLQQKIIETLFRWANINANQDFKYNPINKKGILNLVNGGLIEIGAHTMNHIVLSKSSRENQRKEIQNSKSYLEKIINKQVSSFSYPYGTRSDYTSDTEKIVRQVGFTNACSNFPDLVLNRKNSFQLPRYVIRNWGGKEFKCHLNKWFNWRFRSIRTVIPELLVQFD